VVLENAPVHFVPNQQQSLLTNGRESIPESVQLLSTNKSIKPIHTLLYISWFGFSLSPCSFGLSTTSQRYFYPRTNQPPATSQQYFSQNKPAPAISHQPNEQAVCLQEKSLVEKNTDTKFSPMI
jgi:hypothetical protein